MGIIGRGKLVGYKSKTNHWKINEKCISWKLVLKSSSGLRLIKGDKSVKSLDLYVPR